MSRLAKLQQAFQHYLLSQDLTILSAVDNAGLLSAEKRLMIYGRAYQARLIGALSANFKVLKILLGEDTFNQMATIYLAHYPSSFRSIRWYGDRLPAFLRQYPAYSDKPYLAELAQFEWIMTLVFDAQDAPCLSMQRVAVIPPAQWSDMRFKPHPSLYRFDAVWNVVPMWRACIEGREVPQPASSTTAAHWLLWRNELVNRYCYLPIEEAWAIDAMLRGATFGEIGEGLCRWVAVEEAGLRVASLLKGWVQSGLFSGVV